MTEIRLCWMAKGGGIGASPWQHDTPAAREAMRVQIEEGATMTPPVLRWIDVKDVQPRTPLVKREK